MTGDDPNIKFLTKDGVKVWIRKLEIKRTFGNVKMGTHEFMSAMYVRELESRAEDARTRIPLHVIIPEQYVAGQEKSLPGWQLEADLGSLFSRGGDVDVSYLDVVWFEHRVKDRRLEDIVLDALADLNWRELSVDVPWF